MKKKFDQESVYNLCASVFITILITLFCGIVVAILRPIKSNMLEPLSREDRLSYCEKNGLFSTEKFAELQEKASDLYYWRFRELLGEQKEFRDICLNANSLTEISLWINLKKVKKELQNANRNYISVNEKLREEIDNHKKTADNLNASDDKLKQEQEKLKNLTAAFWETSEKIEKGVTWIPFLSSNKYCLKNYNNLVETFAEIYNLKLV